MPPRNLYPHAGHSTFALLSALKADPHFGQVETGPVFLKVRRVKTYFDAGFAGPPSVFIVVPFRRPLPSHRRTPE